MTETPDTVEIITRPIPQAATLTELVEYLCEVQHDAYERAAAGAGWSTQEASRKPWAEVPEPNRVTMRASVTALLAALWNVDSGGLWAAVGDAREQLLD